VLVGTAVVGLPLVVAAVALHGRHWYPVLDLAMTEFRVRDVFGPHTPLIGLPGRIGEYPDQGSHPGPLSFYLLAPTFRLLGSSPWALEVGAIVVHLGAIATALWIGWRRRGRLGVAAVGAVLVLAIRGYGQILLTQPWNPYLPVLSWIVVLLAVWAVLCGDALMLVPAVVAGSLCAQTHVPYLVPAGALVLAALGHVAWWGRHDRRQRRLVAATAVLGAVLWAPPVVDQLTNDPGNIRKLVDHFGSPPEPALGWWPGVRLMLAHLDVWAGFARQLTQTGRFVATASTWRGALVLALWAVAAVVAWRVGSRALQWLHVVVGAALVLGAASMARIFGKPWYYLTLWAWGITAVMLGAIAWSGVALLRHLRSRARPATRTPSTPWRWSWLLGGGVAVVSLATAVSFADAQVPEVRLSEAVRALAAPTEAAVVAGVGAADGPDQPYQVRWSDAADIGSPGFGLLAALERDGLDVAADPYFHVPVTDHRTRERPESIAQIQLATGSYIDAWRQVPGAVEVATYEPRTVAQRLEFAATRRRLLERLASEDLDDLVPLVDTNVFGAALDPRLSVDDQADFTTLLDLGQPMAVFIAPVDAEPAPPA
jgi:hypothetical protein